MEKVTVRAFMVPLAEYATVSQEATLGDAVFALEEAQEKFDQKKYKHRAILVYDEEGKVVGKLSQMDVIRSLEPGYKEIGDLNRISRSGYSAAFIKSMMESHGLWRSTLSDLCAKGVKLKVRDIMYTPDAGEYVEETASLEEGIHRLIIGHHQSLLVTDGNKKVVGILRLTDVFSEVARQMRSCNI